MIDITTLESEDFKNKLKTAIECGNDTDYMWDGENENVIDIFRSDVAMNYVIDLLKDIINGKDNT